VHVRVCTHTPNCTGVHAFNMHARARQTRASMHAHPARVRTHVQAAAPLLAARVAVGGMTPPQVACIAWAYARLQHHAPILFRAILKHALAEADRCALAAKGYPLPCPSWHVLVKAGRLVHAAQGRIYLTALPARVVAR